MMRWDPTYDRPAPPVSQSARGRGIPSNVRNSREGHFTRRHLADQWWRSLRWDDCEVKAHTRRNGALTSSFGFPPALLSTRHESNRPIRPNLLAQEVSCKNVHHKIYIQTCTHKMIKSSATARLLSVSADGGAIQSRPKVELFSTP
jgi:hypothetical protein